VPSKIEKTNADQIYVCWESFVGNEFGVAVGDRFRGDHQLVVRFPERFVIDGTPTDQINRLRAANAEPPPPPEPIGRVKLRVLPGFGGDAIHGGRDQEVLKNGRRYTSGDTFESEGADAQFLIDGGFCEVVKTLKPRKEQASAAPTTPTGLTVGPAGFQTGRSQDDD
jgi:hypothetical protein